MMPTSRTLTTYMPRTMLRKPPSITSKRMVPSRNSPLPNHRIASISGGDRFQPSVVGRSAAAESLNPWATTLQ